MVRKPAGRNPLNELVGADGQFNQTDPIVQVWHSHFTGSAVSGVPPKLG